MSAAFEGSAPGRLDVMGGIADYSGSWVLQMPIRQKTSVSIKLRSDYHCSVQSDTNSGERLVALVDYRNFLDNGVVDYAHAQLQFKKSPGDAWIAYVLGCALLLQKEKQIEFKGADINIRSDVPFGKGVSSSASLEVATMKALSKAFNLSLNGTELPMLAQRVENLVVGAPCGLMDQLTAFFGEPRKLLPILCQPDKISDSIPMPPDISFLGIDSGVRHSVGGSSYADVRCAAFMGYTIIARDLGLSDRVIQEAILANDFSKLPFGGCLCNIPVAEFEKKFKNRLPDSMSGKDFLSLYHRTIDRVTSVKETTRYSILRCTAHPVYENERVQQFMQDLISITLSMDAPSKNRWMRNMGQLMYQSHASYSECGLGSDRTDEIVNLTRGKSEQGIFGAKITGGGSGGTVCLLAVGSRGKETVNELHQQLIRKYRSDLVLFEN